LVSAPDWWCTDDQSTFEPVVCWARVKVIDSEFLTLGASEAIVGLTADEVGDELHLDEKILKREFVHRDEFAVVGRILHDDRYPRKA